MAAPTRDEILVMADLLMGMAHVDEDYAHEERDAILDLLREYSEEDRLPVWVRDHVLAFDPGEFRLGRTVHRLQQLGIDSAVAMRLLVRLLDADDARDVSEEQYFFQVARALGVEDPEWILLTGD